MVGTGRGKLEWLEGKGVILVIVEKKAVYLPSKTGCKGGLIVEGSGIWPQSFEAFSETSVASSEAGVR